MRDGREEKKRKMVKGFGQVERERMGVGLVGGREGREKNVS